MKRQEDRSGATPRFHITEVLTRYGTLIGFALLCVAFSLLSDAFLQFSNIVNILMQSTMLAIVSFGLTLIMIAGGFDLSLASIVPASGLIATFLVAKGWNVALACLTGLIPGVVIGALNALNILWLGIPDFIATLGMMSIVKGIVYMATQGRSIWHGITDDFTWLGRGTLLGIPVPVVVMFLIFAILWVMLSQTRLGRHMYASGGNAQAARLSGIDVRGVKAFTFVLGGVLAAICGVFLAARLGSGQPAAGGTYLLDGIAAAFLGKAVFSGGQPHLPGTLVGVLIISTMNNGLVLLGVSYFIQDLVKGLVLIIAVALTTVGSKERSVIGV